MGHIAEFAEMYPGWFTAIAVIGGVGIICFFVDFFTGLPHMFWPNTERGWTKLRNASLYTLYAVLGLAGVALMLYGGWLGLIGLVLVAFAVTLVGEETGIKYLPDPDDPPPQVPPLQKVKSARSAVKKKIETTRSRLVTQAESASDTIREALGPYKKYVGVIALSITIDHFILGDSFTNQILDLVKKLGGKSSKALDSLVGKISS